MDMTDQKTDSNDRRDLVMSTREYHTPGVWNPK